MQRKHVRSVAALCLSALLAVGGMNFTCFRAEAIQQNVTPEFTQDGFTYRLSGTNATLLSYSGTATTITVPASVVSGTVTYTVTAVGSGAFGNSTIQSVTFSSTVTSIEEAAFAYSEQLTKVNFSNALVEIGDRAFAYCTSLNNITGTDNVKRIGDNAFEATPWKVSMKKASSRVGHVLYSYVEGGDADFSEYDPAIFSIAPEAFANNTSLTGVILPSGLIDIGTSAFAGCTALTSLDFTACTSLTDIAESAFDGAGLSGTLTLPSSVKSIGSYAFRNCKSLTNVVISENENLASLPTGLFSGCEELTQITLPASIKTIGNNAFYGCAKLNTVNASGLLTIGYDAFRGCTALPASAAFANLTSIDTGAFDGTALYTTSAQNNNPYIVIGKVLYRVNLAQDATVLAVPDGIVSVTSRAAVSAPAVSSLYLPSCLASFDDTGISLKADAKIVSFTRSSNVYDTLFALNFGSLYMPNGVASTQKDGVHCITGLAVTQNPTKMTYTSSESFVSDGIVLGLALSDNTTATLTDLPYSVKYSYNWSVGNTVTISLEGITTTLAVQLATNPTTDSRLSIYGVQIRISSTDQNSNISQGLRFISEIDRTLYDILQKPQSSADKGLGFGSVVFPTKYLDDGVKLTKETTKTIGDKTYYAATVPAVVLWKQPDETSAFYTVCLTDIPQTKDGFTTAYTVVPYATYADQNGNEVTVYGESYSTSVFTIAEYAYQNGNETEVIREYYRNKILNVVDPDKYPFVSWSGIYRP